MGEGRVGVGWGKVDSNALPKANFVLRFLLTKPTGRKVLIKICSDIKWCLLSIYLYTIIQLFYHEIRMRSTGLKFKR